MLSAARVTPAPPTDLDGLVAAYEQTARSVLALGRSCPPERAGDPTPCPGWDVFAQVAHVESVESTFLGEPVPVTEVPDTELGEREHVRSDMGRFMEQLIESRRGLSLAQVCDRLETAIERRSARWRAPGVTTGTEEAGPFGTATVGDVLRIRCFDIWTHEQDLREALQEPGGLDSPAAAISVAQLYAGLGRVVARAGVPVGETVVVEVRGPVAARQAVRVLEVDGRRRGVPAEVPDEDALCVLLLGTREFGRLAAGRLPVVGQGWDWDASGDAATASRLLEHLAMTP
jgi:uncharacterized protein (TIGR03083 family)